LKNRFDDRFHRFDSVRKLPIKPVYFEPAFPPVGPAGLTRFLKHWVLKHWQKNVCLVLKCFWWISPASLFAYGNWVFFFFVVWLWKSILSILAYNILAFEYFLHIIYGGVLYPRLFMTFHPTPTAYAKMK